MTPAPTVSASAIEAFDPEQEGCPRLWAWTRIDGLPKPRHPSAGLGDLVHKSQEAYLIDGTPHDLSTVAGRIAHTTQQLLPEPGQAQVEVSFKFDWEGVTFSGRKDYRYWTQYQPEARGVQLNVIHVGDHKTTSNFQYAKNTREKLLNHPQAPLYALSEYLAPGIIEPDIVQLEWNYAKTGVRWVTDDDGTFIEGPNGMQLATGNYLYEVNSRPVALDPPVRELVTKEEAITAMKRHLPVAQRMVDILTSGPDGTAGVKTALELEPNPDICNARKFGKKGCPFKSKCNLSAEVIAQAAFAKLIGPAFAGETEKKMDPLEAFLAKNRPQPAAPPATAPVPPAAVATLAPVEAQEIIQTTAAPLAKASVVTYNPQEAAIVQAGEIFKAANAAINPPEHGTVGDVLPSQEPPTTPDTPKARRGRPPGSVAKAEPDAYTAAVERIATALEKIAAALNTGKAA